MISNVRTNAVGFTYGRSTSTIQVGTGSAVVSDSDLDQLSAGVFGLLVGMLNPTLITFIEAIDAVPSSELTNISECSFCLVIQFAGVEVEFNVAIGTELCVDFDSRVIESFVDTQIMPTVTANLARIVGQGQLLEAITAAGYAEAIQISFAPAEGMPQPQTQPQPEGSGGLKSGLPDNSHTGFYM